MNKRHLCFLPITLMTGCYLNPPIDIEHDITSDDLRSRLSPSYITQDKNQYAISDVEIQLFEYYKYQYNMPSPSSFEFESENNIGLGRALLYSAEELIDTSFQKGDIFFDAKEFVRDTAKWIDNKLTFKLKGWDAKIRVGGDSIGLFFTYEIK